MKKKVIGFVHTHWDREWYREFEVFRMRLLRVFDNILDLLESNKLPSFYFDGQTSALEDYLEMRPEKTTLIKELISDKRLFIGPFYCLIDEFLTDETVMRKNIDQGLSFSKEFGCQDFVGYFADTFGHTPNVIPILREYNIDTAIVWRGCGDLPSEFTWENSEGKSVNCINLVRGYFNDFFSANLDIDTRVRYIKENLDKIADKSGDVLLMPIGGDHLGVASNLIEILTEVNSKLNDYEIELGTIFDYINLVKGNFKNYVHVGELRDNSKTFTLQGSFSSRLDLKRLNIETSYILECADRYRKYFVNECSKYDSIIDYAYKLLIQNQAHDSIYGCSLDDVHREDIIRYKKIQQIANTIIDEIKFNNNISSNEVINLSNTHYKGVIEFKTNEKLEEYQLLNTQMGFEKKLMTDTLRVPVTEDYGEIYTYLGIVDASAQNYGTIMPANEPTDVFTTNKCIGNSKIFLSIENNKIKIGNYELKFVDYVDNGDSYNEGPLKSDIGKVGQVISSKSLYTGSIRSAIEFQVDIGNFLTVVVELDSQSDFLKLKINWNNTYTNHKLMLVLDTQKDIQTTFSEETNVIVKREFDSNYNIRENLPETRGLEAKNNTAPMQRGVSTNGLCVVTKGLTQYEVQGTELGVCLLRSTGILSNPKNSARTTPAGPPIPLEDLKQLGQNFAELNISISDNENLQTLIDKEFKLVL